MAIRVNSVTVIDDNRQLTNVTGADNTSAFAVADRYTGPVDAAALHRSPNAITSMFVYDTSKDSDGGAWTEKCQNTSWYNETLSGKWLGSQTSEFYARCTAAIPTGYNLVANGTFDSTTGWGSDSALITAVNGKLHIEDNPVSPYSPYAYYAFQCTIGKAYILSGQYFGGTKTTRLYIATNSGGASAQGATDLTGNGTTSVYFTATATTMYILAYTPSLAVGEFVEFDNISVYEVIQTTKSGDYFQLTTDGKFYKINKNLLANSEQFDKWTWSAASVTPNIAISPIGTQTADKIIESASSNYHYISQGPSITPGLSYTFTIYAKAAERSSFGLEASYSGVSKRVALYDLSAVSATMTQQIGATGVPSIVSVGNGWYKCTLQFNSVAGEISAGIVIGVNAIASYAGDGTSGLYIWGAQLEQNSQSTDYEVKGSEGASITEVFRGNKREFPKLSAIVAEATNVTIYDLTEAGRPMWMRFYNNGGTSGSSLLTWAVSGPALTGVFASNSIIGICATSGCGTVLVNFAKDDCRVAYTSAYALTKRNISDRNISRTVTLSNDGYAIAAVSCNSIGMTVLTDAPIDPVTGLKAPTIAVATANGVSVINHNNIVFSSQNINVKSITIDNKYIYANGGTYGWYSYFAILPILSNFTLTTVNQSIASSEAQTLDKKTIKTSKSVVFNSNIVPRNFITSIRNDNSNTISLINRLSDLYNIGWSMTATKRSFLNSSVVGIVTGDELYPSGAFTTDFPGFTKTSDLDLSIVNGRLRATGNSTASGVLYSQIYLTLTNTIPGEYYRISGTMYPGTVSGLYLGTPYTYKSVPNNFTMQFIAVSNTTVIQFTPLTGFQPGSYCEFDDISIRNIDISKNLEFNINKQAYFYGTLTKSPVATNAQLVGYSGFSTVNYLREPCSTDLEFGTGEWSVGAWIKDPAIPIYTLTTLSGSDINEGAAVYNPTTNSYYIGTPAGYINVVSADTYNITAVINSTDYPTLSGAAYCPVNNTVYFTARTSVGTSGRVRVLDCASNSLTTIILPDANPIVYKLEYLQSNNCVYVASQTKIYKIDCATGTASTLYSSLSGSRGMTLDQSRNLIYAGHATEGIHVIDALTGAQVTVIATGSWPGSLAYNPTNNKVYGSTSAYTFAIVDVTTYTVTTTSGPSTLRFGAYNSLNNKVYFCDTNNARTHVYDCATDTASSLATGAVGALAVNAAANVFILTGSRITIYKNNVELIEERALFSREYSSGPSIKMASKQTGYLVATVYDGTTTRTITTDNTYNTGAWLKAEATYRAGRLAILVNGVEVKSTVGAPLLSLNSLYNLLTYTTQFDNSAWYKGNILAFGSGSIADTTETTDPLGTNTADKIVVASGSNIKVMRPTTWPAVAAGTVLSGSVYLKAGTHPYVSVAISQSATGSIFAVATINLSTGVITKTGTGGSGGTIVGTPAATSIGNGWYRVTISGSYPSGTNAILWIMPAGSATPTYDASNFGADTWASAGTESIYVWGAQLEVSSAARTYQRVGAATDFDFQAPLTIGNSYDLTAPFPGSLALVKLSATVPTADQAQWMYEQEKQMFREGAQVTLPDSNAITDLTYCEVTNSWIAASSSNISRWNGLVRTSVTPVSTGTYSRVASSSGVLLSARAASNQGVDITILDSNLYDELTKPAIAAAKQTEDLAIFDYVGGFTATTTGTTYILTSISGLSVPAVVNLENAQITGTGIPASTTISNVSGTTMVMSAAATATGTNVQISFIDFPLPVGYTAEAVLVSGERKREGASATWSRLYDGFRETIRFGTAPGYNAWVQIQATRSNT